MKTLFFSLAALCACLTPLQVHGVVMELKDQQTMVSENLTLNDLLKSSQGLSDDDLSTAIAAAPSLGKSDTWTRDQIEKVLPTSLKAQPLEWAGASACVVSRPAVQFTDKDAKQLVSAELARHLPADSDFAILQMPGVDPFPIPQGQLDMQVELSSNALRSEWADATLEFRYQGKLAVTSSRIPTGSPLISSTFQQIEVNVLKIPGLLQPATDFPEGKVAAHPLSQGKILMESDWVEPVLVKRDDLVTILYDHHGISITVEAKAMDNGVRDQVIAVQNLESHKIFNARVVNERSLVYDE